MLLFIIESFPGSAPNTSEVGGAFVNVWMDMHEAFLDIGEQQARRLIKEQGWIPSELESSYILEEKDPSKEDAQYYNEAKKCGSCLVFNSYPKEDDSEDESED